MSLIDQESCNVTLMGAGCLSVVHALHVTLLLLV